ncbi:Undecaprenyl-diphosphatase BcrC [Sporomusa carbonis]
MQYDYNLLMFINGWAGHIAWLDRLMILISKYGPLLFCAYLVFLWFSGASEEESEQNRRRALYAAFSALLAMGITESIGAMWHRNRPYYDWPVQRLLPMSPSASFPSGHATGGFAIAGSVILGQRSGSVLMTVFAVLMALSRVYTGVHYPSDVIAGMAVGILSSYLVERYKFLLERPIALALSMWHQVETRVPMLRG